MAKKRFGYYERLFKMCRREWSSHHPGRKEVLANAKIKKDGLDTFKCAYCTDFYAYSHIQVDHIEPIANTKPETHEDLLICLNRLHTVRLQILCKPCHKVKTKVEGTDRAKERDAFIIAEYMSANVPFVLKQIEDSKILKKMANVIKKMKTAKDYKLAIYQAKWDFLMKKYF
jgi:5-methylcytosine-specific restriction endonuclease McrA